MDFLKGDTFYKNGHFLHIAKQNEGQEELSRVQISSDTVGRGVWLVSDFSTTSCKY